MRPFSSIETDLALRLRPYALSIASLCFIELRLYKFEDQGPFPRLVPTKTLSMPLSLFPFCLETLLQTDRGDRDRRTGERERRGERDRRDGERERRRLDSRSFASFSSLSRRASSRSLRSFSSLSLRASSLSRRALSSA